jgi:hypothetical protein
MFRFANGRDETAKEKEQKMNEEARRQWVEHGMKEPVQYRDKW